LGELYFKEGNANAGSTYVKAVKALSELEYAITADNAKLLSKGKTKVAGIGKGTSDKIYEFYTTGVIDKLEEKRGNAA
jgi:DNA polymerase/3'-5' exonuclease PolX